MGLFETMGIALDPNTSKISVTKDWYITERKLSDATRDEPAEYSQYLHADCEFVLTNPNHFQDYTIYEWLEMNGNGNINDLNSATVLVDGVESNFKKVKDDLFKNGTKLKILSEEY